QRYTIFETPDLQLVGLTIPNFWRKTVVPVRVGDKIETRAQLLQLWVRANDRAEEVLVLYPADGYWRARPLPPQNLRWSAYGSSFLIGPIETAGRPLVDIRDIEFDPQTRTFTLNFTRGGNGKLTLVRLDQERIVLDVALSAPVSPGPFAALRSMFVTEGNCDVAQVGLRGSGKEPWSQQPVMEFARGSGTALWAG